MPNTTIKPKSPTQSTSQTDAVLDSLSGPAKKRQRPPQIGLRRKRTKPKQIGQLDYTSFVIGDPKTRASLALDAKLQKIFHELNQTESWRFHSPYRDYLADKIHDARIQTDHNLSIGQSQTDWTVTLTRGESTD